jgi:transposase-like protein
MEAGRFFLRMYVPIDPATKTAAVKRFWRTGNLKATAAEFGVSRNAIYDWVRIAEQNLEAAFVASTPGKKAPSLAEQNQKLQSQLKGVLDACHQPSQGSLPSTLPVVCCPRCASTALLRNGRVRSKRHGLLQRLWCRTCNVSVYLDVKKTL